MIRNVAKLISIPLVAGQPSASALVDLNNVVSTRRDTVNLSTIVDGEGYEFG